MSLCPHILEFSAKETKKGIFSSDYEKNQTTNKETPKSQIIISDYTNKNAVWGPIDPRVLHP